MKTAEVNKAVWLELKPQLLNDSDVVQRYRMHNQLRHVAVALINRNPHQELKDCDFDYDDMPETPKQKPSRQNWWEDDISLDALKGELKEHVNAGNMSETIRLAAAIAFKTDIEN